MNACLSFNAPGMSGPEDMPEYRGPSVDDLIAQKMSDPGFLQGATCYLEVSVYEAAANCDAETFLECFRSEARKWAEREAREEYEEARQRFCEENS